MSYDTGQWERCWTKIIAALGGSAGELRGMGLDRVAGQVDGVAKKGKIGRNLRKKMEKEFRWDLYKNTPMKAYSLSSEMLLGRSNGYVIETFNGCLEAGSRSAGDPNGFLSHLEARGAITKADNSHTTSNGAGPADLERRSAELVRSNDPFERALTDVFAHYPGMNRDLAEEREKVIISLSWMIRDSRELKRQLTETAEGDQELGLKMHDNVNMVYDFQCRLAHAMIPVMDAMILDGIKKSKS